MNSELHTIRKEATAKMQKTVEVCIQVIDRIRTGRPTPALLENLTIDYYGTETPIKQVATITTLDARSLSVSPWDKKVVPQIEHCIRNADLGLNPVVTAGLIRVPFPQLTAETRTNLGKQVAKEGEQSKISVRNIRRDANSKARELIKNEQANKDEVMQFEQLIQQDTDAAIVRISQIVEQKKKDLMQI